MAPAMSAAPQSDLRPELVAALVRPASEALEPHPARGDAADLVVPYSFRAAILAGLIVAILVAAANASFADMTRTSAANLDILPLGNAKAPLVVALILAALWSGARTSALCLLVAHRLLARMRRTSLPAYAIASGMIALAVAFVLQLLGDDPGPGGLGMDLFAGLTAGLFYRFFAGVRPAES